MAKNGDWPGWRGANRDARVAWLPDSLPDAANFEWTVELAGEGLGGIAAAKGLVVIGSRDVLDQNDVFQCFNMHDGTLVWEHAYPALGKLDYGNSPLVQILFDRYFGFFVSYATCGAPSGRHQPCLHYTPTSKLWR